MSVLCCFYAHLADEHLTYRTIKVNLSAVHHMQIVVAQSDPFVEATSLLK